MDRENVLPRGHPFVLSVEPGILAAATMDGVTMANFLFAYRGGNGMATTPEAQEKVMAEWGAWFATLGSALVDGGKPFAHSQTVHKDGSTTSGGESGLTGYSVVAAADLPAAADLAKGCPLLADGGTVEVYATVDM
jgi:hypothetical protein